MAQSLDRRFDEKEKRDILQKCKTDGSMPTMREYGIKTTTAWLPFVKKLNDGKEPPFITPLANSDAPQFADFIVDALLRRVNAMQAEIDQLRAEKRQMLENQAIEQKRLKYTGADMMKFLFEGGK